MVLVVIKAANGAVDDFRVNGAESEWTVAELKNYLYRHYPTHPVCVRVSVAWFSSVLGGPVWWECRTEKQRRRPVGLNVATSLLYLAHQKPLIHNFTAQCIPMPDL